MCNRVFFFFVLLFFSAQGFCGGVGYGDLTKLSSNNKFDSLVAWYYGGILNLDSSHEFIALNQLLQQGKKDNDPALIVGAYDLMACYTATKLNNWTPSIELQLKAIETAQKCKLEIPGDVCINHLGFIYYSHGLYVPALEYLLRAHERLKAQGFENVTNCTVYIHELGLLYYDLGDYETALHYYAEAVPLLKIYPLVQNHVLNNFALCFRNLGQYDSALVYFHTLLNIARKNKDSVWMGIATGNIGSVYLRQRAYEKAKPFCTTDYQLDLLTNHPEGVAGALTCLGEIILWEGKPDEAIDTLKQAEKWLKPLLDWNFGRQVYLYNIEAKAYAAKKDYGQAYHYQQLANWAQDSLDRRSKSESYAKIEQQISTENYISKLSSLEDERKSEIQKRNFSLAGILLMTIIAVQVYYRQKLKRGQEKELHIKQQQFLLSEKMRADEELQNAQTQLKTYVESLLAKNNLIEQFEAEIEYLRSLPDGVVQTERIAVLQTLQNSTILTEEDWFAFKQLFDKAHQGFLIRLKEKYPTLTQAEVRLMALTKLNLSGKEMAAMLGISADSIKKARQRLRKKINLPEDGGLEEVAAYI